MSSTGKLLNMGTDDLHPALPLPSTTEGHGTELHLESTLGELPLNFFQVEEGRLGIEVAHIFEQYPLLPGVTLTKEGRFLGLLSRQRLLEYLIRPHGELFLQQPLSVVYSYARTSMLVLPAHTPILTAAQQALRRSPEMRHEPIVVQTQPNTYGLLDVQELGVAYWQIRGIETQVRYERSQVQMIQSDKMANLGRLVDGVAHEILDPVSFIWGNLSHIGAYSESLLELLAAYEQLVPNPPQSLLTLRENLEFDYLRQDLPKTMASIRSGAERLSNLATSLQNFCHIDEVYPRPANLHECLDGILLLLKSRLTTEIEVVKHYGYLPPVPCFIGQLSQVFMNLLSNAIDALLNQAIGQKLASELGLSGTGNLAATPTKPQITLTTQILSHRQADSGKSRWVVIRIGDNGPGLSAEAKQQVLETFTIARRAAKETSLSVSYQIITAKHGGQLKVHTWTEADGRDRPKDQTSQSGTEFEIWLPLA